MSLKKKIFVLVLTALVAAFLLAELFLYDILTIKKPPETAWRYDFKDKIPASWVLKGKPGTKKAVFSVARDDSGGISFLRMKSDRASASLITKIDGTDLAKTPILRWRWRVRELPKGADGRIKKKDDQAIGIYVGSGSTISNKSISYRWDTETPKGEEGACTYGMGAVKVKWYTLRNKEDAVGASWFTEERNIAEDFKKAWGYYPKTIFLSISCNSQYTGSVAEADMEWIELTGPDKK